MTSLRSLMKPETKPDRRSMTPATSGPRSMVKVWMTRCARLRQILPRPPQQPRAGTLVFDLLQDIAHAVWGLGVRPGVPRIEPAQPTAYLFDLPF